MIANFAYLNDRKGCKWSYKGHEYIYHSKNQVVAIPLKSGKGILIVEPASPAAPDNAVIIDAVGNIYVRIKNPEARNGAICFCDAFYIQNELALTIAFSSFQMRCIISDEGDVLSVSEAR